MQGWRKFSFVTAILVFGFVLALRGALSDQFVNLALILSGIYMGGNVGAKIATNMSQKEPPK